MAHLKEQFLDIHETYVLSMEDGKLTLIEGAIIAGKIGEAIKHLAETFIGTEEHFKLELIGAKDIYNRYFVPLDLPVWDMVEPTVDRGIWTGIEEGAYLLRAKAIENNPELAQGA